jgi:hypothetical protein
MKLADFTTENLKKSALSLIETSEITITSVFPVKATSTGLERVGINTPEMGTLYCLKSQIQNPIDDYKGGVAATATFTPNKYTNSEGVEVETMRVTNIVLHILTPEKQAELKMVAVTL